MNRLAGLKRISKGKRLLLIGLFFLIMVLLINGKPFGVAQLKVITHGVGMLDMEMNYTPTEAYRFLDLLGEAGRAFHIQIILWLDMLFPLSYALFFAVFSGYFINKVHPLNDKLAWLGLAPILAGLFDYIENTFELIMLTQYPQRLFTVAYLANIANGIKYLFNGISLGLMIFSLGWFLVRLLRKNLKRISA